MKKACRNKAARATIEEHRAQAEVEARNVDLARRYLEPLNR